MNRSVSIRVTGTGAVFAAACILILPFRWILVGVTAAAFHELCHIAALKICHVKIFSMEVGPLGATIETGVMLPAQQLLCAAAGPLGSFALLMLGKWTPLLSLLALMQGIFNLLPVYPMDGGHILTVILTMLKPNIGAWTCQMIGIGICLLVFALLFVAGGMKFAAILSICMILRILGRKISCKDGTFGLQ